MSNPRRVALVTSGRFHLLDLARELRDQGHEVAFYSCVPHARAASFGLPVEAWRPLAPLCYLLYWLGQRARSFALQQVWFEALQRAIARTLDRRLEPCDDLIALSGLIPHANARFCRERGARLWIERGSRHYLSQIRILATMPCVRPPRFALPDGELADYANADRIVVPAAHVVRSFLEEGVSASKLFCNPYGVDLRMFAPTVKPPATMPATIVMVGRWSYQKGCDVLTSAWRGMPNVRLCHVGPVDDCPLPTEARFSHIDSVDQFELRAHYGQAHVFALASRQEGLALVQAQALACGLRLVCTDRTGGEDLRVFLPDPQAVTVVPSDDVIALRLALLQALTLAMAEPVGMRNRLGDAAEGLSWRAYGRRYSAALLADFTRAEPS
jgi:glycosyltransferase involved in cell wall biosynthesis